MIETHTGQRENFKKWLKRITLTNRTVVLTETQFFSKNLKSYRMN